MKGEAEGVGGRVRWLGLEAHGGGEQGSVQGGVCGSSTARWCAAPGFRESVGWAVDGSLGSGAEGQAG